MVKLSNKYLKRKSIIILLCILLTTNLTAQNNFPSREERIYDLSKLWKEIAYNFVFPETLQNVNIDSLYFAYLPKVEQVKNNYEYFRVLSAFMAHFNEGHTRIMATQRPDEPPALECINFGEKIVVGNIAKRKAEIVPIGSEIIKVNNIPVLEFLNDSVFPYISAANSHWKFDKGVNEMLFGKPQSTVKITVKTPEGKQADIEMKRGVKEEMVETISFSPINVKNLEGNIGYVHLSSFLPQHVRHIDSVFLRAVTQLKNSNGLIIDIRGNRGGITRAWQMVAACLTPSISFQGTTASRKHIPMYATWGASNAPEYKDYKDYYLGVAMEEIEIHPITTNIPERFHLYNQPIVIISNSFVGSATESFLSLMIETERATVIGSPSAGCNTSPLFFSLSSGFEAMIAIGKYLCPDKTSSVTTGILPDIEVHRDYIAYLEGRDNVLERAIEELRKMMK